MRIVAVTNQKGGVGKTTTAVNLAAALAARQRKILLIDLDPQGHLSSCLGVQPGPLEQSCYEVLTRALPLGEALIPVRDGIKLLGSGLDLAGAEQELVSIVGRETILRDAIATCPESCDYILIDCPPSLGLLTLNALAAAREVFIPLQPHFLSLQGLSQLLQTVLLVQRRISPSLTVSGLLFCMFDSRTSLALEIVGDIEQFLAQQRHRDCPWNNVKVFQTRVRRNVKLAESPSHGQTIFEYEPNCHGAEDYLALAEEVETMLVPAVAAPGGANDEGLQQLSVPPGSVRGAADPETTTAEQIEPL